ncbi:MAG: sigma 54-interacting transcriptional regulator [Acidobacteriota bacterium]
MIADFKDRLAARIRDKEIGLVMLVDRRGRIRWSAGRPIEGRTVRDGRGFSRTHLEQVLDGAGAVDGSDVMVTAGDPGFPQSARFLYVRSLYVHPVDADLVLYADSGNDVLDPADVAFFAGSGEALRELLAGLREAGSGEGGIAGTSAAAARIRELVLAYALEDDPVLILGETGVGKSHVAQLIHRYSGRTGQCIVVDVPAIPEALFESELFGHSRGAFTGATRAKRGLVEAAEGGTLFLDEIAEVPLQVQAKLLRFIETQRFRPVGDTAERSVSARIIAATNRDLPTEISRQRFREDLYYRLNVLAVEIPPLRERVEDLRVLVEENRGFLRGKQVGPEFWTAIARHDWPGNVRELLSVVKRAGIQLPGPTIGAEVAGLLRDRARPRAEVQPVEETLGRLRAEVARGRSFWDTAWAAFLDREINRAELRSWLGEVYAECGGSLKDAARRLGVADAEYARFVSALHKYRVHPGR